MQEVQDSSIIVNRLIKNFEVTDKKPGIIGSLSSIVAPKKKTVRAVKNISFRVEKGELVGFIGPNGAGKTTTLKILSGLLYPTSGFTQVLGFDPWERKPEYLKKISLVMGQKNQLWWDLPAMESLLLNKAIYEIDDRAFARNLDTLVSILDVGKFLYRPVRRLSLGQRMRLELLASLLHKPEILFLDEPTLGLDVIGQQKIRDFIFEYNKKEGATILLTSHNMDDVVNLAKRVIVIDKGEIFFDGELSELVDAFAKEKIIKIFLSREADLKILESIGKIKKLEFPQVTLSVPRGGAAVAAAEILQNVPVADLNIEEEPIEEIIRKVFKKGINRKINKGKQK